MPTALITGPTRGLGLHVAQAFAARSGWNILLAVRDTERGADIATRLGSAAVVPCDLASLSSIRAATARLSGTRLDALVLNAGIQLNRTGRTSADGYELTFAVNHLAHFALTTLLRDRLLPTARIAVVSSGTHFGTLRQSAGFPAPRWGDPHALARARQNGNGRVAYATSKLANVLFAYEAARRLAPVAVNAFDPGLMPRTGLLRDYPRVVQNLFPRTQRFVASTLPFGAHPHTSAAQLAALVADPEWGGITGRYIERGLLARSSPASYDRARAAELWEASAALTGTG